MTGILFTGCSTTPKKITEVKPSPIIAKTGTTDLKASPEEVAKQNTKDADGQAFTDQEKQDMANSDKAKDMVDVFNKKLLETMYNCNPSNIDQSFKTMNSLSLLPGGIFAGDTDKTKESLKNATMSLVRYDIKSFSIGLEYELNGKTFSGIEETLVINYLADGVAAKDEITTKLIYNAKGDKSFSVYALKIGEAKE